MAEADAASAASAAEEPAGPSIPYSKLSQRAGFAHVEWCPTAEEDGSIPLPPEQRGKIGRYLADDEGEVPGRWMDVPMPNEVWGGAVGLTKAMVECLLLPAAPALKECGVDYTPTGGLPEQAARARREPEVPEGTELQERAPAASVGAGGDAQAGGRAAAPASGAGAAARGGAKTRSAKSKMSYFRENPDDGAGDNLPTPQECFADLGTFGAQTADHWKNLFAPDSAPAEAAGAAPAAEASRRGAQAAADAEPAAAPAAEQAARAPAAAAAARAEGEAEPPAALPPPP